MNNKKIILIIGAIALVILGYFALSEDEKNEMAVKRPNFEILKENEIVHFNTMYKLDDEWSFIVSQFVPSGTVSTNGDGVLNSVSDAETNPAIKIDFYQNSELKHYQISFQKNPGMHSPKNGQVYFVEMHGYDGFQKVGDAFLVETLKLSIGKVKSNG